MADAETVLDALGDATRRRVLALLRGGERTVADLTGALPVTQSAVSQALRVLRNDPVTARIPVLALSANAMPGDIRRGLSAGFFRYLTKPIDLDVLLAALDAAWRSGAAGEPPGPGRPA